MLEEQLSKARADAAVLGGLAEDVVAVLERVQSRAVELQVSVGPLSFRTPATRAVSYGPFVAHGGRARVHGRGRFSGIRPPGGCSVESSRVAAWRDGAALLGSAGTARAVARGVACGQALRHVKGQRVPGRAPGE